jgi:hypothetical protein
MSKYKLDVIKYTVISLQYNDSSEISLLIYGLNTTKTCQITDSVQNWNNKEVKNFAKFKKNIRNKQQQ